MLSKTRITYLLGIMLMVSSLLMVVANNVPILASFRWLWGPSSILYVVMFSPKALLKRSSLSLFIYGILFCALLQYTLWSYMSEWFIKSILDEFLSLLSIVLFVNYLRLNRYYEIWGRLSRWGLIFIFVTGLMTIVATEIAPQIVRASYSPLRAEIRNYDQIFRIGFGSYGFMTALVALFPFFVYKVKYSSNTINQKFIWILIILFFVFVLIRAQLFANIIVSLIIIMVSYIGSRNFKRTILYICLFLGIATFVGKQTYIEILTATSDLFDSSSNTYDKLHDMAFFISNPEVDATTGLGNRASRYPMLIEAFWQSPLQGYASNKSWNAENLELGQHLHWMSRIAIWGLFGFSLYVLLLKTVFTPILKSFISPFRFYYGLSLLSIVIMGFVKTVGGRELFIVLLIIIPGFYYSGSTNTKNPYEKK